MYHVSELSYSHVLTEDFIAIFHNNTRYNLSQLKIAIFLYLQLLTEESPFIYMSSPRTSYLAVSFFWSGLGGTWSVRVNSLYVVHLVCTLYYTHPLYI